MPCCSTASLSPCRMSSSVSSRSTITRLRSVTCTFIVPPDAAHARAEASRLPALRALNPPLGERDCRDQQQQDRKPDIIAESGEHDQAGNAQNGAIENKLGLPRH